MLYFLCLGWWTDEKDPYCFIFYLYFTCSFNRTGTGGGPFRQTLFHYLLYNINVFERVLRYILGYSLIFAVIILMISKFFIESKYSTLSGRKILDLRDKISNGLLKERDIKWLKQILNGEKYSVIARESAVSDGTMRNRIMEVFKIIGTSDKKQFIAIYSDALIISTKEEFQAWKDTLV